MGRGRGRGQDFQAGASGTQRLFYVVVSQTERADQPDMQGTFLYLHMLSDASCSLLHLV